MVSVGFSLQPSCLFAFFFDDLLTQCKLYAVGREVFASPVKEMSLLFWMIFAQHKTLIGLEKCLNATLKWGDVGER